MNLKPDDEMLAQLFEVWSREKGEAPDLNRIAQLASGSMPPKTDKARDEILSLDPEMRRALFAAWEYCREEPSEHGERDEPSVEMLMALAESRWRGVMRVCHGDEALYRVTHGGDDIRIAPWIDKLFDLGKRMLDLEETGLWPTDEVSFSWPGESPLLEATFRSRGGETHLMVHRCDGEAPRKIEIEYWRGNKWVGVKRLGPDDPELAIPIRPAWPYLLIVHAEEPLVLKLTCNPTEFSPSERRMAALLRLLAGDIGGSFQMIQTGLVPAHRVFTWTHALIANCLPEQVEQAGYAVVRNAAVRENMQSGLKDIFTALAFGWLTEAAQKPELEQLEQTLEKRKEPVARGFLLALRGKYEEALNIWELAEEAIGREPYTLAARRLAGALCFKPKIFASEERPLPDKELEIVMRCAEVLSISDEGEELDLERLADCLNEASR